jgi:hypothetical protein
MIQLGIEPATFRLVVQCLNHALTSSQACSQVASFGEVSVQNFMFSFYFLPVLCVHLILQFSVISVT